MTSAIKTGTQCTTTTNVDTYSSGHLVTEEYVGTVKIQIYSDAQNLIGILMKSGYVAKSKKVMKEFPRDTSIDYFEISIYREPELKIK